MGTRVKKNRRKHKTASQWDAVAGGGTCQIAERIREDLPAIGAAVRAGASTVSVAGKEVPVQIEEGYLTACRPFLLDRDGQMWLVGFALTLEHELFKLAEGDCAVIDLAQVDACGFLEEVLQLLLGTQGANVDLRKLRAHIRETECTVENMTMKDGTPGAGVRLNGVPWSCGPLDYFSDAKWMTQCAIEAAIRRSFYADPANEGLTMVVVGAESCAAEGVA
jgi:hypothetical protein